MADSSPETVLDIDSDEDFDCDAISAERDREKVTDRDHDGESEGEFFVGLICVVSVPLTALTEYDDDLLSLHDELSVVDCSSDAERDGDAVLDAEIVVVRVTVGDGVGGGVTVDEKDDVQDADCSFERVKTDLEEDIVSDLESVSSFVLEPFVIEDDSVIENVVEFDFEGSSVGLRLNSLDDESVGVLNVKVPSSVPLPREGEMEKLTLTSFVGVAAEPLLDLVSEYSVL